MYEIQYRSSVPKLYQSDRGSLLSGVGKLKEVDCTPGWHKFQLEGTRKHVYAASRGVIKTVESNSVFVSEDIVSKKTIAPEVKKLRSIGADDVLRRQEIEAITTYLDGLGVKSFPDDDYTEITIKYLDLTTLKAVLSHVYHRALLVD
jgi:hypothetical protein